MDVKIRCCLILLVSVSAFLTAQDFLSGLSADERATLDNQDILVRFINNTERICVPAGLSAPVDVVADAMREIRANYLAEAMWRVPVAGYEDLLPKVDAMFRNMDTFKEIPYYPEGSDTQVQLFTVAEIIDTKTLGHETFSTAHFRMDPFDTYGAELYQELTEDSFVFTHQSTDSLHYLGLPMIGKGKMRAAIAVVRDGDYWFVYAAGGVRAPKPPLLRKALERAFNNRIKDFASFYIKKVKRP